MTAVATLQALEGLARPLRARSRAGWAAGAVGLAALVLGGAAWLARLSVLTAPWWVLAAWALALVAVGAVLALAWRREAGLALRAVARRLEEAGGWRHGAISALLDVPARGTSEALFGLADRSGAATLSSHGAAAVEPLAHAVRRRLLLGAAALTLGLGTLAAAGPLRGAAAALWHPARAWAATIAPVRLTAAASEVDRDATVALDGDAAGRHSATLWLRAPGEAWQPTPLLLDSLGHARFLAGPLRADLYA